MSENIKQSLRALLSEIVDYAGLFPPSASPMQRAVENYAEYLNSEHRWMLGRFVCPVARLAEFGENAGEFLNGKIVWRLSALIGENLAEDLQKIENFNAANDGRAVIDAIEIKAVEPKDINLAKKLLPANLAAYFEIPLQLYINEFISAIAINRLRAKIRTGGVTKEAFPPVDEVVKFLRVCIAANLPFKATAGLHHPLRCQRALTYEENATQGVMHGFLNVFSAAAFLRQNLNAKFINQVMTETEVSRFEFDDEGIVWNGNRVDLAQIRLMRERNAISFGSCSFTEPIEDLRQLGLLH
ncbi:MAG: hypothetical protein M3209_12835 [Acidobacteriota bacterium]|nr:hypothetical protein [Acidobacteriota bacterium]